MKFSFSCNIFLQFLVIKTLDPDIPKMLDPDPDPVNPDSKHCLKDTLPTVSVKICTCDGVRSP
jgi:hypothetical protein